MNDDDFLPSFSSFWSEILKSVISSGDIADWWDNVAKPAIKQFCISYSKQRKSARRDKVMFLLSYLKIVLKHKNWCEVARIKEELKIMNLEDAMGFVVRSRHSQNSEEEKASLYHAAREVKNNSNNIDALKVNGNIVTDNGMIENTVTSFFSALFNGYHNSDLQITRTPFAPDYKNFDEFMNGIGTISDMEARKMEDPIQMDELENIIKKCKNNKSPGLDGLPYEFYRKVWAVIRNEFKDILQCQLDRIRIVDSNKQGVTRLISKVNGIPKVDELRPITLLNTDYKILSKFFVKRIKPRLSTVILSRQLCTVEGRNILFGINNVLSSMLYVNCNKRKHKACILSLDFFKAYDRVLISYLVKVMARMNFSPLFCSWIRMLHDGAHTCFLLRYLSRDIQVSFSIRQGDPLAMILYIIYIEPLLLYLERHLVGLFMSGIPQSVESYCDDVNLVTEDLLDLVRTDTAIRKFEAMSGAILSRNNKCKVLGLGAWESKYDWPLPYVQCVDEIKMFGILLKSTYSATVKRNWDYRFQKFSNCIHSWSSRRLPSLLSKVEVMKAFALARVYYVASILPIKQTMIKKFESVMGKFLWRGWLLRVALDEVKNGCTRGGLGLVCLKSMCDSLLLSQFLRLLKSSDLKSIAHVGYWIGESLGDLIDGIDSPPNPPRIPEYFAFIESLVVQGRISDIITPAGWKKVTNRILYAEKRQHFPVVKVERESPSSFSAVWKRISSTLLPSSSHEIVFMLIHNKLPVKERLFRVRMVNDPYCDYCPGAETCDLDHFFCSCERVRDEWNWVCQVSLQLLGDNLPSSELIRFKLPKSNGEKEVIWLLGHFVEKVWNDLVRRGNPSLKAGEMFGYLKFKYRANQHGARQSLNIPEFN